MRRGRPKPPHCRRHSRKLPETPRKSAPRPKHRAGNAEYRPTPERPSSDPNPPDGTSGGTWKTPTIGILWRCPWATPPGHTQDSCSTSYRYDPALRHRAHMRDPCATMCSRGLGGVGMCNLAHLVPNATGCVRRRSGCVGCGDLCWRCWRPRNLADLASSSARPKSLSSHPWPSSPLSWVCASGRAQDAEAEARAPRGSKAPRVREGARQGFRQGLRHWFRHWFRQGVRQGARQGSTRGFA